MSPFKTFITATTDLVLMLAAGSASAAIPLQAAAGGCRSTTHLRAPTFGAASVTDGAGKAYVFGGSKAPPGTPSDRRWTAPVVSVDLNDNPPRVCRQDAAFACTGPDVCRWGSSAVWDTRAHKAYLFGGTGASPSDAIDAYDPSADHLGPVTSGGNAVRLPTPRWGTSAVWIEPLPAGGTHLPIPIDTGPPTCTEGCAYLFGGMRLPTADEVQSIDSGRLHGGDATTDGTFSSQTLPRVYLKEILRFDPARGLVEPAGALDTGLVFAAAATNHHVAWIIGGLTTAGAQDDIRRYDPSTTNVMSTGTRLRQPRLGAMAAFAAVNPTDSACDTSGCVYVFGGRAAAGSAASNFDDVLMFDPDGGQSTTPVVDSIRRSGAAGRWGASVVWSALQERKGAWVFGGGSARTDDGRCPIPPSQEITALVNAERSARGRPILTPKIDLARVALGQSQRNAANRRLAHNPHLRQQVRGWTLLSENVDSGEDSAQVNQAFMASHFHRTNMLDRAVNQVGIGVAQRDGRLWVTEVFAKRPRSRGQTVPAVASGACYADLVMFLTPGGPLNRAPINMVLLVIVTIILLSLGLWFWRKRRARAA